MDYVRRQQGWNSVELGEAVAGLADVTIDRRRGQVERQINERDNFQTDHPERMRENE